jgi:hypothetical protein
LKRKRTSPQPFSQNELPPRLQSYLQLADFALQPRDGRRPVSVAQVQPPFAPPQAPRLQAPAPPMRPKTPHPPKLGTAKPPKAPRFPKPFRAPPPRKTG